MKRFTSVLLVISIVLFIGSISWGLLARTLCTRSNDDNFKEIQPESFVPDTIETVLQDESLKQLYVCYNDANCVNVYTETGEFLWCVSTPYMRNSYFELKDGKLIIYDVDAYIYDAKSGSFIGLDNADNLDLSYEWEKECAEKYVEGSFYFDSFQVYRSSTDGTVEEVVGRPWWHKFFNFGLSLFVAFLAAAGIGISIFIEKRMDYDSVKKAVIFENRRAYGIKEYFRITSFVQLIYAVLNVIAAFFTDWLILGIIPVTIHMIFSSIILWNMKDRLSCNSDEMKVVEFWTTMEIGSYIIAFISVIVASSIVG